MRGVIADERRHVGFGVTRIREALEERGSDMDVLVSTLQEFTDDMMQMFMELADTLAGYGMDVNDVMGRVRRAQDTHWRRLGLPGAGAPTQG
jgi:hypothetical protein